MPHRISLIRGIVSRQEGRIQGASASVLGVVCQNLTRGDCVIADHRQVVAPIGRCPICAVFVDSEMVSAPDARNVAGEQCIVVQSGGVPNRAAKFADASVSAHHGTESMQVLAYSHGRRFS